MVLNPLEQFKIHTIVELPKLFGHDINFTNSSLFMMISVVSVILFLLLGVRKGAVIPGYLQAAVEYVYDFVTSIIESNTGS